MKKQMRNSLIAMAFIVTLSACGASNKTTVIQQEEYHALHDKYLLYGTILAYTWNDPEELRPEYFPTYYAFYFLHNGGTFEEDEEYAMYIPQEDVETMVQSHFDVSTDFLRSGSDYRPEREAYEFYGIGSSGYTQVTSAEQNGALLTICYDMIDPADKLSAQGIILIDVKDENYKYISNTNNKVR